ncbi:hypothetical protein [Variovorax sp. GB1P17]|uniref:hypothetical protein n=1 Tax=Variovorax sp. GB1P17 TaxID=3443740 RepID=UPI003F483EA8
MNKKARRAALLASALAAQSEPGRKFDADCMVRIPDCQSIIEVLRLIKHGGAEWAHRYVTLWIPGPSNAWVVVYPLQREDGPYFDFMYTRTEPPQEALSVLLGQYPECTVIDWSPGRLACIQTLDPDVETLARIIHDVAEAAWGEHVTAIDASYEEMGRA